MSDAVASPPDMLCQWCLETVFGEETFSFIFEAHDKRFSDKLGFGCTRNKLILSGSTDYCFCGFCDTRVTRKFSRPLKSIEDSARVGECIFCSMLKTALTKFMDNRRLKYAATRDFWNLYNESTLGFEVLFKLPSRWCSIGFPRTDPNRVTPLCFFRLYPVEQGLASRSSPPTSPDPAVTTKTEGKAVSEGVDSESTHHCSPQALTLEQECRTLRAKIRDCILHHEQCKTLGAEFRPNRLLHVSGHHSSPTIRLEELPDTAARQSVDYVCLSYCWGVDQPGKLTTERLSTYKKGIPTSAVSKSILDAAVMTLVLGFEYLWVDAYCIIQDSEEDKSNEIAKMASIYSGGVCTISIASASAAGEGWLSSDDHTCASSSSLGNSTVKTLSLDRTTGEKKHTLRRLILETFTPDFDQEIGPEPLHTRGWTLQESLLSPRLLTVSSFHQGRSKLRCSKCITLADGCVVCQASPLATYPIHDHDSSLRGFSYTEERWHNILLEYTNKRSLTDKTDKLNALAGIASEYTRLDKLGVYRFGSYIAGMWSKSLLVDLLWQPGDFCREEGDCGPVADVYVGPSWSWVVRDHPIKVDPTSYAPNSYASVKSYKLIPKDPRNPNGALRYAELTVVCGAAEVPAAEVCGDEIDDRPYTHDINGTVWYLDLATEEPYNTPHFVGLIVQEVDRKRERQRNPEVDDSPNGPTLYRRVGMFENGAKAYKKDEKPFRTFTLI